ncbi:hypothetical protein EI94DRAFT_1085034 [Lactarius quietus]|nr:hypothetical protein EI94DRAFT_1085034 [Lactarius quietus]
MTDIWSRTRIEKPLHFVFRGSEHFPFIGCYFVPDSHGRAILSPALTVKASFRARRKGIPDFNDTFKFVVCKLTDILKGQSVDESLPPPITILCNYINETPSYSTQARSTMSLLHQGHCNTIIQQLAAQHPYIAPASHP